MRQASPTSALPKNLPKHFLYQGDCIDLLTLLPEKVKFDLIVTSPPYNIGKPYEQRTELQSYINQQETIIKKLVERLSPTGSLCWQVGTHVQNGGATRGQILPLDILFHPLFAKQNLQLRNRIIWRFGHGLHCKHRFSGRYETVLWYTKTDSYKFNLDAVRVPAKYPSKRSYKGPKKGEISGHPQGKNPEDVWDGSEIWDIPNVKGNHVEKVAHPCQFPVGLAERLILSLSDKGDLVFDPYAGVATTGVAAALHERRFLGAEISSAYAELGLRRLHSALDGGVRFRSHSTPIYDHTQSKLSYPVGLTPE